jgi:hypothetical protein
MTFSLGPAAPARTLLPILVTLSHSSDMVNCASRSCRRKSDGGSWEGKSSDEWMEQSGYGKKRVYVECGMWFAWVWLIGRDVILCL